ncbi:UDP-N-acetylglucosamine 2-epimerase [Phytoactinopolyspora halophila]|uniref:UDP-N-acetylglucosamine 2-epimerase n=1 Tax=Phytoactinopolyspora halophila TaxID=1981511 RepID=UPI001314C36D|nr:UDP-N-acetylglucosamine 2-epimerase [Phytoactinopolyspora halophila]
MRRVCVFTGSRADYGPLLAVIRALANDPDIDLRLLVTGGHLVREQGLTVRQIEADGFVVDEQVDVVLSNDTPSAVAKSLGLGIIGYTDALDRMQPDVLLVLGDRYEALGVVIAANLRLLPVAHISGGELSFGSTDDSTRHAITKLASVHFTANEVFRRRVIQMGEDPGRVHVTGVPSIDTIMSVELPARDELESLLGIELRTPLFAVTYHPATADLEGSRQGAAGLVEALETFAESTVVVTGTNVDQSRTHVLEPISRYIDKHAESALTMPSLGQTAYLSLVKHADVVIGNSSSGLIEAPALKTPTVNIGTRQDGRPRAASVIDCDETAPSIGKAIRRALTWEHHERTQEAHSPFGDGQAAVRIVDVLKNVRLDTLVPKAFVDLHGGSG